MRRIMIRTRQVRCLVRFKTTAAAMRLEKIIFVISSIFRKSWHPSTRIHENIGTPYDITTSAQPNIQASPLTPASEPEFMQHDTISTLLTISSEELKRTPLPSISELPSTRVKQVYIIGKSMSCWLTIPSKHISRQHVMIRYDGNGQYSLSSNSKNGTLLNNYRIDGKGWKPLKHHDVIGLTVSKTRRGTCIFIPQTPNRRRPHHLHGPPPPPPPPPSCGCAANAAPCIIATSAKRRCSAVMFPKCTTASVFGRESSPDTQHCRCFSILKPPISVPRKVLKRASYGSPSAF